MTWDEEEGRVRVTAPDIQGIHSWWMGDDMSRVWRVASKYQLSAEEVEILYGRNAQSSVIGYRSPPLALQLNSYNSKLITVIEVWTIADFELYLDGVLAEKKPNPYGFIPFVIFPMTVRAKVLNRGTPI